MLDLERSIAKDYDAIADGVMERYPKLKILRCGPHAIYRYMDNGKLESKQAVTKGRIWVSRNAVLALKRRQRGGDS